jgi:hypothetical protein
VLDKDLARRIDSLRSGVEQSRCHVAKRQYSSAAEHEQAKAAVEQLEQLLVDAAKKETPPDERVRLTQRVDAELCLYEPVALLKADRIRLEDRFYRFSDSVQKKWQDHLASQKTTDPQAEDDYRQVLRQLTYEVAQAAEDFNRKSAERAKALAKIVRWVLVLLVALLALFVFSVWAAMPACPQPGCKLDLLTISRAQPLGVMSSLLLAGALGAMTSVVPSVLVDEKARSEYVNTVLLNMLVRVALGSVYAVVVAFAILSGVIRIVPTGDGADPYFYLVIVAVVAGVSDKLFGKVIGAVIQGKPQSKETRAKETRAK